MKHSKPILHHAVMMVGKTLKSYALLSVTIVLSFSLLLGYLVFTDSSLYNRYKTVFSANRGMILVEDMYLENGKLEALRNKAENTGNTKLQYYHSVILEYTRQNLYLPEEELKVDNKLYAQVFNLPKHTFAFCSLQSIPYEIVWLDGQEHTDINLSSNEAIVDEVLYHALEFDKVDAPEYTFYFSGSNQNAADDTLAYHAKIVGYIKDAGSNWTIHQNEAGHAHIDTDNSMILLSSDEVNLERFPVENELWRRHIVMYSDSPEEMAAFAEKLDFVGVFDARCIAQNQALEKIQTSNQTKAIIAAALLLLLGINLYSSFTNALNDRKFEIGVKRAVGASAWAIVRQFMYESILVMVVNILISIAVVADVFLVYKLYLLYLPRDQGRWVDWTIWLSSYSIGMFAACAVALTVVFSLIFAYKSTQVQVVDYLKAE